MSHPPSSDTHDATPPAYEPCEQAVAVLAQARGACLGLGVSPRELARMFLDEAMPAFLIEGLDDESIRAELATAVAVCATPWLGRLRQKSGMCDCVAEVHFEAECEARLALEARTGGLEPTTGHPSR